MVRRTTIRILFCGRKRETKAKLSWFLFEDEDERKIEGRW